MPGAIALACGARKRGAIKDGTGGFRSTIDIHQDRPLKTHDKEMKVRKS
jgi:hypothetical protein